MGGNRFNIVESPYEVIPKRVKTVKYRKYVDSPEGIRRTEDIEFEKDADPFIKIYYAGWLHLLNKSDLKLLEYILDNMYYGNALILSVKECSSKTGIPSATITKSVQKFIKIDFMTRMGVQRYAVNPNFIYKGLKRNITVNKK